MARTLVTLIWTGGFTFGLMTTDLPAAAPFCSGPDSCLEVAA